MAIIKFSKRKVFWSLGFVLGMLLILFGKLGINNFLNHKKLSFFSKIIFVSIVKADVPDGDGGSGCSVGDNSNCGGAGDGGAGGGGSGGGTDSSGGAGGGASDGGGDSSGDGGGGY